jgi:hypothetical protein
VVQAMVITIMVPSIATYWKPSRLAFMKYKAGLLLAVVRRRLRILYQHLLPVLKKTRHIITRPLGEKIKWIKIIFCSA